jgi:glucosamine 6-phosphate synthetase-like amidotransferase/phosphosugar isomerase protein
MCGLAAVLLAPRVRSQPQWQSIWQHFTENLQANEIRGRAATGVAITTATGGIYLEKQPIPASEFITTHRYHSLPTHLNEQTVLLLGHTRLPTQGDPGRNDNNHPLLVGDTLGIHNGHINNSEAIFQAGHLRRESEVDSEVIFRLLDTLDVQPLNLATVAASLRQLEGRFTILAIQQRSPQQLLIVRHQNPLSIHYHPEWKALLFSSSYVFLRKAFGPIVRQEVVPRDQLLLFNTTHLEQYQAQAVNCYPLNQILSKSRS